jgi:hypothetical protein
VIEPITLTSSAACLRIAAVVRVAFAARVRAASARAAAADARAVSCAGIRASLGSELYFSLSRARPREDPQG